MIIQRSLERNHKSRVSPRVLAQAEANPRAMPSGEKGSEGWEAGSRLSCALAGQEDSVPTPRPTRRGHLSRVGSHTSHL